MKKYCNAIEFYCFERNKLCRYRLTEIWAILYNFCDYLSKESTVKGGGGVVHPDLFVKLDFRIAVHQ